MNQFDTHSGTAKLAQVLDRRTSQKTESPLTLDFGEIQANSSLKTNTFPVPIPKGDYTICKKAAVTPGDRVLVGWIQSEAVVIDVIEKS